MTMEPPYFNQYGDPYSTQKLQGQGLLSSGWRPFYRQLDLKFVTELALQDTSELLQKTLNVASRLADSLGRSNYTWWANLLNLGSADTRYYIDELWNYITPEPPGPDHRHADSLSIDTPVRQVVSRDNIAIDYVFHRLRETTILKILNLLGRPDLITQYYLERHF